MSWRLRSLSVIALSATVVVAADKPVRADVDGDGNPDSVTIDQSPESVRIQVSISSAPGSMKVLSFGVGGARQDAVCRIPVQIDVEPIDCSPDGQALPGCKSVPSARELVLDDGDCDAIRVYWNHDTRALDWWRR
jgi:hypothetical protein